MVMKNRAIVYASYDTTNEDGLATFVVTGLAKGDYVVYASFEGDEQFAASEASSNLKISTTKTKITVSSTSVAKGSYLNVYLKDANGLAIANTKVSIKINGKTYTKTTNANGLAQLKLTLTAGKTYKTIVKFAGNNHYVSSSNTFNTKVVKTSTTLTVKNLTVVKGTGLYVTLKTKSSKLLANQKVYIKINAKTYTTTTNSKGVAFLSIKKLTAKSYKTKITYKGNSYYYSTSKTVTVKVIKTSTTLSVVSTDVVKGDYLVVYLKTKAGKALSKQKVYFKINGKTYSSTTDSKGKAKFLIKTLTIGKTYKTTITFKGTSYYYSNTKSVNVLICRTNLSKKVNGAIWVHGYSLNNRDYGAVCKELASHNIKNIFLYVDETTIYTKLPKLINAGKPYGIKVHAWFEVFYEGGEWIHPTLEDGSLNQKVFDNRITLAKKIAKIDGIGGIHLDYLRDPSISFYGGYGNQSKTNAVSEFTRQFSVAIKSINPNIILSAAVMPELYSVGYMTADEYYYGQDIAILSKYLDIICPMVYKGNYHESSTWIKSTTKAFVKEINGNAKLWVGLQGYKNDDNPTLLSVSELNTDCNNAIVGGADGIGLFRFTVTNLINF